MRNFIHTSWQILKASKTNFQQGEPIVYSAAIAFFTIFSLPSILVFLTFIGSLFFSRRETQGEIVQHIQELISGEAAAQVSEVLSNLAQASFGFWGILIGTIVLVQSGTVIFLMLQKALNAVWQLKVKSNVNFFKLLKHRIPTLLLVAILGFLFISSIMLDMLLTVYREELQDLFEEYLSPAIHTINTGFNIVIMLVFFTAIHKVLPDAKLRWKSALAGGIITTVLFLVGKEVVNLILENLRIAGIYSTAGSLVVILLWVFYSAVILMLGAEVTKAYAAHYNLAIEPSEIAIKYKKTKDEEV